MRHFFYFLSIVTVIFHSGCRSPYFADRGAAFGAITGALTGAAIGEHNGDAAAGAVIGSTVGALTGAAVGETIDYEIAQSEAIIESRLGREMSGAVSVPDVIAMTHADLSDGVINSHIRANGVARPPSVDDLITLRNAGVRDSVIQALQTAPPPVESRSAAPPVIVEQHHYVEPIPWHPRFHGPPPFPRRGHGRGLRWGVSLGN